jgi:hypothetical protein
VLRAVTWLALVGGAAGVEIRYAVPVPVAFRQAPYQNRSYALAPLTQ